jgi:membrane protease YdiL (CAAX protease family)
VTSPRPNATTPQAGAPSTHPAGRRDHLGSRPAHPVGRWVHVLRRDLGPRFTHPILRRVPRWGSVADPGTGGAALSTGPATAAGGGGAAPGGGGAAPGDGGAAPGDGAVAPGSGAAAPGTGTGALTSGAVVAGGLVFLLARPALGSLPFGVGLLAGGYLVLLVGAVVVRTRRVDGPLGWGVPLGLGLVAVAGAGVVGGPVAERRVGAVAAGLALLAAVAEEALFRRVLYDRLLRFGVVAAVAGSAVGFALVHLPAYGLAAMPVDLGAALLLSWQRYASGRWTVPAVTHAVANLLAVT